MLVNEVQKLNREAQQQNQRVKQEALLANKATAAGQ